MGCISDGLQPSRYPVRLMPADGSRSSEVTTRTAAAGRPTPASGRSEWATVRQRLHERGLRWTPQRRILVEVLSSADGHVTGADLVERCRAIDPATIPSTVYRTLDVLEEVGLIRHSHGADGREEFHVLPAREHGHLTCRDCGATWDIDGEEGRALVETLRASRGFAIDLSHLSVVGRCRACAGPGDEEGSRGDPSA
jgi:Fur family ferric uptake transcriptional regulator